MDSDVDRSQAYPSYTPKLPDSSANEDGDNFASFPSDEDGGNPAVVNHDNSSTQHIVALDKDDSRSTYRLWKLKRSWPQEPIPPQDLIDNTEPDDEDDFDYWRPWLDHFVKEEASRRFPFCGVEERATDSTAEKSTFQTWGPDMEKRIRALQKAGKRLEYALLNWGEAYESRLRASATRCMDLEGREPQRQAASFDAGDGEGGSELEEEGTRLEGAAGRAFSFAWRLTDQLLGAAELPRTGTSCAAHEASGGQQPATAVINANVPPWQGLPPPVLSISESSPAEAPQPHPGTAPVPGWPATMFRPFMMDRSFDALTHVWRGPAEPEFRARCLQLLEAVPEAPAALVRAIAELPPDVYAAFALAGRSGSSVQTLWRAVASFQSVVGEGREVGGAKGSKLRQQLEQWDAREAAAAEEARSRDPRADLVDVQSIKMARAAAMARRRPPRNAQEATAAMLARRPT